MTILRKLTRYKRLLGQQRKPDTAWREELGLLRPPKDFPLIKKGWPVFERPYDPDQIKAPGSFRQYKPPPQPRAFINRDAEGYTPETFHELLGKFEFEAQGFFPKKAELAEREVFTTAFNLHLVGWVKVRTSHILGHVQGDTFALSYFRRWLEEKHLTPEAGTIELVQFWANNTGLESPLKYKHLVAIKDKRKYKNKKVHILASLEQKQIESFERKSAQRRQQEESFMDANCVRNY